MREGKRKERRKEGKKEIQTDRKEEREGWRTLHSTMHTSSRSHSTTSLHTHTLTPHSLLSLHTPPTHSFLSLHTLSSHSHSLGLDPKTLASIINTASGRCWSSEVYNPCPGVVEGAPASNNYQGGFGTGLMAKVGLKYNQEIGRTLSKISIPDRYQL